MKIHVNTLKRKSLKEKMSSNLKWNISGDWIKWSLNWKTMELN